MESDEKLKPNEELQKWGETTEEIRILRNNDSNSSKNGYSLKKIAMWTLIFSFGIGFAVGLIT